jgi:hypothetical protein
MHASIVGGQSLKEFERPSTMCGQSQLEFEMTTALHTEDIKPKFF